MLPTLPRQSSGKEFPSSRSVAIPSVLRRRSRGLLPNSDSQRSVGIDFAKQRGQFASVLRVAKHKAILAVTNDFAGTGAAAGYDGQATSHSFQNRQSVCVLKRRTDVAVGSRIELGYFTGGR